MGLFQLFANAHLGTFELATFNWAAIGVGIFWEYHFVPNAWPGFNGRFGAIGCCLCTNIPKDTYTTAAYFRAAGTFSLDTSRHGKILEEWRDNLVKVLFMFPIAVAIIAAGRILLMWPGSTYGGSTVDQGNFVDLLFVLVGFFGPLFILPKTFKWAARQ